MWVKVHIFVAGGYPVGPAPFVGDSLFSTELPLYLSHVGLLYLCGFISGLSGVFHWLLYASMTLIWWLLLYNKSWNQVILVLQLCSFSKVVLAILDPLISIASACQFLKNKKTKPKPSGVDLISFHL